MRTVALWGLLLTASGVTAYDWSFRVEQPTRQARTVLHALIVGRTADSPERYRILIPYALDPVIRAAERWVPYEKAFGRVYATFHLIAIAGILLAILRYLTEFYPLEHALVVVLLAGTTLPMTLRYYDYSPYSLLEPALVAVALRLIYRHRYWLLAVVLFVATLNRETAIFIVLLYFATCSLTRNALMVGAGLSAIWAATFFGVRWYAGEAKRYFDLPTIWHGNTNSLEQVAIAASSWVLLLGAVWIYALLGLNRAPSFIRRTALVLPLYLTTILIWGTWVEVRLLLPMYPVLLSLALAYLFDPIATGRANNPDGTTSSDRIAANRWLKADG